MQVQVTAPEERRRQTKQPMDVDALHGRRLELGIALARGDPAVLPNNAASPRADRPPAA